MQKMRFWLLLILLFTSTVAFAQTPASEEEEEEDRDLPDIELKEGDALTPRDGVIGSGSTRGALGIPGLTTGGALGIGAAIITTTVILSNDNDSTTGTTGAAQ